MSRRLKLKFHIKKIGTYRQRRLTYAFVQFVAMFYFGSRNDIFMTAYLAWCVGVNSKYIDPKYRHPTEMVDNE